MRVTPEAQAKLRIGEILMLVFELIELRPDKYPSKLGAKAIADFIYRRYPGCCPEEIYTAFELALANVIPAKLEHFQSFGLKFFTGVFNSYLKYKSDAIKKAEKIIFKPDAYTELLCNRPINDKALKEIIVLKYLEFCETGTVNPIMKLSTQYDFMDDCGLVEIGKERKLEILEQAENKVIVERMVLKKHYENIKVKGYTQDELIKMAKHLAALETFKTFQDKKFEAEMLADILENKACYIAITEHSRLNKILHERME